MKDESIKKESIKKKEHHESNYEPNKEKMKYETEQTMTHHRTTHAHHIKEKTNTKLWIMAAALGLLVIIAGVQATELIGLKGKLSNEVSSLAISGRSASAPTTAVSTGRSGSLSNNLKNLPTMVGGC